MQVKKLGYILFMRVIATICILPVAVMPWQTEKAVGNEQLASFPELRKEDGSFNTGILNEFSDYFADHFGLRHEMITLNDQLTGTVLKTLDSSSVLLGKDDWLFYKSTLADYTGAEPFTARQSYAAAHVLGLMQEYCEENGIGFCFTIAPNKNSCMAVRCRHDIRQPLYGTPNCFSSRWNSRMSGMWICSKHCLTTKSSCITVGTATGICGAHSWQHRLC